MTEPNEIKKFLDSIDGLNALARHLIENDLYNDPEYEYYVTKAKAGSGEYCERLKAIVGP